MKKRTHKKKRVIILYHADCSDGFGAAWAAWKKFGARARYIPVNHQVPPPKFMGKEIYMVDFTYPAKPLAVLVKNNKRVTAIDHHMSVRRETLSTQEPLFDNDHSGSVLAWNYFHPKQKVPKLLRYIEDMDLWRFRLAKTKPVVECLELIEQDFQKWDAFIKKLESVKGERECVEKGKLLLEYEAKKVRKGVASASLVIFEGYKAYAVNSPFFHSEIAYELYKKLPPIAIVWSVRKEGISISLRSNGSVDVAKLAQKYGGGGHRGAAGFKLKPGAKLPWKLLRRG